MTILEFRNNREIGKLIQFAFDLHKRYFKHIGNVYRFDDCYDIGRKYNNVKIYGIVDYTDHEKLSAIINLYIVSRLKKNNSIYKDAIRMYTCTDDYKPYLFDLKLNTKTKMLENCNTEDELFNMDLGTKLVNFLVEIGFRRNDIIAVINGEMTAREAYQNVAPNEIKNRQWICEDGKFYEFDENITVDFYLKEYFSPYKVNTFSGIKVDDFPWPFEGQPIIDCSIMDTSHIDFGDNDTKTKLININSNPNSIEYADIRNAIIDEVIDASKVDITGTIFGEQTIINLDKSLKQVDEKKIRLAFTGIEEERPRKRIRVLSNASNPRMVIEGLAAGAQDIGLFRGETLIANNLDLVTKIVHKIDEGDNYLDEETKNEISNYVYHNAKEMYAAAGDNNITFRFIDIHPMELAKKIDYKYENAGDSHIMRGAYALTQLHGLLKAEARAIIRAAKESNKDVRFLIPYVENQSVIYSIKRDINEVIQEEQFKNQVLIGAMIESKKAVLSVDKIAEEVDFISIGTNDLTESILSKKRNDRDRDFYILNYEVKEYITKVVHRIKRVKDIPINICGNLPNIVDNLEFFLSLNIDYITCDPSNVELYNRILDEYYKDKESKMVYKLS